MRRWSVDRAVLSEAGQWPAAGRGERMLRIFFLRHWFNLSDPAVEEALYIRWAMRVLSASILGASRCRTRPPHSGSFAEVIQFVPACVATDLRAEVGSRELDFVCSTEMRPSLAAIRTAQLFRSLRFQAGITPMFITVAICTRNRAESLRRTLDSLVATQVPGDLAWELVVVNNNSTDHTEQVAHKYGSRLPVRRQVEAQPGHSNARNRAIDTARGEYIVWTDDDVLVDPGWLKAYAAAFCRWPDAAVFGGRIVPRYESPVAKWVVENEAILGGAYALRDLGKDALPLSITEKRLPYGANFAIRAKEQRAFRYDPNLGLAPNRRRYYDEIDVIVRLLESGATGYWVPEAVVEHCIGREKQSVRYLTQYFVALGETETFQNAAPAAAMPTWFGVPRRLWLRLLKRCLRYHFHRLVSPSPIWVGHLQDYAYSKGVFRYWRQQKA
jgi:glycosyltransferase involved in cell wall biosynthesis